jgi:hypothetical protein
VITVCARSIQSGWGPVDEICNRLPKPNLCGNSYTSIYSLNGILEAFFIFCDYLEKIKLFNQKLFDWIFFLVDEIIELKWAYSKSNFFFIFYSIFRYVVTKVKIFSSEYFKIYNEYLTLSWFVYYRLTGDHLLYIIKHYCVGFLMEQCFTINIL